MAKITDQYGQADLELRKKRRDGILAAINRQDLDLKALHKCFTAQVLKVCRTPGLCQALPFWQSS